MRCERSWNDVAASRSFSNLVSAWTRLTEISRHSSWLGTSAGETPLADSMLTVLHRLGTTLQNRHCCWLPDENSASIGRLSGPPSPVIRADLNIPALPVYLDILWLHRAYRLFALLSDTACGSVHWLPIDAREPRDVLDAILKLVFVHQNRNHFHADINHGCQYRRPNNGL